MAELEFDESSGVVVPATKDVRDDLAADIQARLSVQGKPEVNVDSTSPLGQVIDLLAAESEARNAEVAFLANQMNPRTAHGVFLDSLVALYGLYRKVSEPTVVTCTCRGLKGTFIPYGAIVQDESGNQLRHSVALGATIGDSGTVDTTFSTVEHGAIEIGAGAVTKIVTVIAGWDSVTNAASGVTGRDVEPDGELFSRMVDSYAINAHGTVDTLESNLAALDGVLDVVVLENYTNETQTKFSVALDPHSVAVCIVGGEDDDIAKTIFERKAVGCGTTGNYEVSYVDTAHYDAKYTYRIVRPTATSFYVRVTFFEKNMDSVTQQQVKDAITKDFLGELSNARVKLATPVYASRFYQCVQDVTSSPIKSIEIAIGSGSYSASLDIPATQSPTISDGTISLVFGG